MRYSSRPVIAQHVTRVRWFAIAVLAHAVFGLASLLVTRWSFRSWPAAAYTWVPGILGLAGMIVLVVLVYALACHGLSLPAVVLAWFLGRIAGTVGSVIVPGVGIDSVLLATSSFGLLIFDAGRITIGVPSLTSLLPQVAVLLMAWVWGRRGWHRATSSGTGGT